MNTLTLPMETPSRPRGQRLAETAMAVCLGIMALAVFVNVVLRYGFGSGIAASEEISRLLFVWMVFIGATAAYPAGEHMAFTSLLALLKDKPRAMAAMAFVIRALVVTACALLGWGAWQQVQAGMGTRSVVLGYPASLLPLPVLLSAAAIGVMALIELASFAPFDLGHGVEVE
jgi:TRAP-type transport system small permease protein